MDFKVKYLTEVANIDSFIKKISRFQKYYPSKYVRNNEIEKSKIDYCLNEK